MKKDSRELDQDSPLELTLDAAACDGIAYFSGSDGKEYFRPGGGEPIRELVCGSDNHPMMYQFSKVHPLAEVGRKFASPREASHYVGALSDFEMWILLINLNNDVDMPEEKKGKTREVLLREQERMKRENLAVLDTVPGFEVVRKYFDMTLEDVWADLQANGVSQYDDDDYSL